MTHENLMQMIFQIIVCSSCPYKEQFFETIANLLQRYCALFLETLRIRLKVIIMKRFCSGINRKLKQTCAVYIMVSLFVLFLLFWHLGAPSVNATDEAYHGVNAYEMLKSGNWLVNTYQNEVDYFNSKPPLNLWLIILSYKIFGVSQFALRFPAALAGGGIYFVLSAYLWKRKSARTAILFGLAFMTNVLPLTYHGFRSGDMDGMFALFFTIAMLALAEIKRHPNAVIAYGFVVGLAFLTKSVHAGTIVVIGIMYLPVIRKKLSVKKIMLAGLAAVLPVMAWAIPRYLYDGMMFFSHGIAGEMSDKITVGQVGDITYPIRLMMLQKNWQLLVICLVIAVLFWAETKRIRYIENTKCTANGKPDQRLQGSAGRFLDRYYLLLCATLVPMLLYVAVQAHSEWYYYPCYLGGNVAAALMAEYVLKHLKVITLRRIYSLGYAAACVVVGVHVAREIYVSDISGDPNVLLRNCIQAEKTDWGETYSGCTAYIENVENSYKNQDEWQCNDVFLAETIMDWSCENGGVAAFLEEADNASVSADHPCVLIISGSLWDQYSSVLTGHVILQDNEYLILSSEMY